MDIATGDDIVLDIKRSPWLPTDPYSQEYIDTGHRWEKLPHALAPYTRALLTSAHEVVVGGFAGIICLRSTWARLGLLIPPTIVDPGFHGLLTMEVFNSSINRIQIRPGDVIWHMILVGAPLEPPYQGRYQNQNALTLAKALDVS